LVAAQLRSRSQARRIVGVDLSANMVEQARASGFYDDVVHADVVEYMRSAASSTFDLVVAADVFIYVGVLEDLFKEVRRILRPNGVLCFTVELADPQDAVVLRTSLRYAHSRAYIESLVRTNGLRCADSKEQTLRLEQRVPIAGLFVWLEAP
jgi:predicted TPR repeat methyltransferase